MSVARPATDVPPHFEGEPRPHRMTVDEYVRAGDLLGWEHTELIGGVVVDMASEKGLHGFTVVHVANELRTVFDERLVMTVGSFHVDDFTMTEPDVLVIREEYGDEEFAMVANCRLVVEVSVWSKRTDLGSKLRHYASAGAPEYWVIDPHEEVGELIRHTDPDGDVYRTIETFQVGHRARALDVRAVLSAST